MGRTRADSISRRTARHASEHTTGRREPNDLRPPSDPFTHGATTMKYYVRVGDENRGPFTIDDLKSRGVDPSTYVWREGMADWVRADQLPELQGALKSIGGGSPYSSPQSRPQQNYGYQGYPQQRSGPPQFHSGFGVTSFVLAMVGLLCDVIMLLMSVSMAGSRMDRDAVMMVSCTVWIGLILHFFGAIFGLIGVLQADRKKVFGVIGLVINSVILLLVLILFLMGMAMAARF